MLKFKNLKILLLLMLFAFAGQAWATNPTYKGWHTYTAKIKVNETGLGKVYGSFGTSDNGSAHNPTAARSIHIVTQHRYASVTTQDQSSNEFNLYLYAVANESTEEGVTYEFVEWQNEKGERVATSNQEEGTAYISKFVTTNKCGPNFTSSQGTSTSNFYQPHQDYHNSITTVDQESGISIVGHIDSTYVAVFRRVNKPKLVTVSVNDDNLGFVECNPTPFDYGKEVTLLTLPKPESEKGFENKFIGWKKDGDFLRDGNGDIVRDVPLKFTVSEETQGHYEAVYESGYKFFHLVNKSTKRTVNAVNDQGSITDFSSLQLVDYDERFIDAGSIFQINNYKVAGGYPHEFIVQGSNTGDYYTIDPGNSKYITIERNVDDFTWSIHPNGQPVYMADEGEDIVTPNANKAADITHWYIEPMDKDLETAENYFSLDPNKLVEVDGKYYTTLRTSWNILFNPEQMTPYIVKSVDETAGTVEMGAITGNIIPAGTPVIIETNSNDIEENRMVPTLTNAASGAVPSGNLLQASTKYFPNQDAPVSNCKGLYKNADGQLAFGGNALNTVNGNEAYLSVANEVVLPLPIETVTLAQLCADGVEGRPYCIKDSLLIVYSKDNSIWVKDNNKSICKDIYNGEQLYLIGRETGSEMQPNQVPQNEYDQSNWLEVQLTGTDNYDVTQSIGFYVNANAIKGTFSNNLSPTMTGVKLQLADIIDADEAVNYNANYYCPASFFGSQQGSVAGVQHNYFFVKPKPQELANVVWAMWNNTEQKMVLHGDKHGFQGKFRIDMELNNDPTFVPADSTAYNFLAIIRKQELRDIGYMVYPLNISSSVITAVTDIAAKQVVGVTYYNVTGLSSEHPFEGVNIVVTRYSDGSTSAAKRIF